MDQRKSGGRLSPVVLSVCLLVFSTSTLLAQGQPVFLYNLSNFSGPIGYDSARIEVDQDRNEAYVVFQNIVRIFSPSGMEVFSFGDGLDLGQILDAAIDGTGDIILLSFKDSRTLVTRCNFRGVPVAPIAIQNLPAGLTFGANRMVLRNGLLYFVSLSTLNVTVTDTNGDFRRRIDLSPLLEGDAKQNEGAEVIGFTVDREGNILFTIPVHFRVYRLAPDGKLTSFGRSGSAPGRFGVIAGIATDSQGNLLVADKLKCVVMVFDRNFNFLSEFGYRGFKPGNLIVPDDIAVDGRDRVYVSQGRRRGVSVFALTRN